MTTPTNREAVDVLKLLLEKFGLATTRFIKGEITREHREGIYDEVYRDIRQTHLDLLREVEQWMRIENSVSIVYETDFVEFMEKLKGRYAK